MTSSININYAVDLQYTTDVPSIVGQNNFGHLQLNWILTCLEYYSYRLHIIVILHLVIVELGHYNVDKFKKHYYSHNNNNINNVKLELPIMSNGFTNHFVACFMNADLCSSDLNLDIKSLL